MEIRFIYYLIRQFSEVMNLVRIGGVVQSCVTAILLEVKVEKIQ